MSKTDQVLNLIDSVVPPESSQAPPSVALEYDVQFRTETTKLREKLGLVADGTFDVMRILELGPNDWPVNGLNVVEVKQWLAASLAAEFDFRPPSSDAGLVKEFQNGYPTYPIGYDERLGICFLYKHTLSPPLPGAINEVTALKRAKGKTPFVIDYGDGLASIWHTIYAARGGVLAKNMRMGSDDYVSLEVRKAFEWMIPAYQQWRHKTAL